MIRDKFQPRYQVHEYPGRKPWYIVRKYLEKYSRPDEIILDPFCGSGVTPCEALISGRKAVALDVDPLAVFISKMTCIAPVKLSKLKRSFSHIEKKSRESIYDLYLLEENCSACGGDLVMSRAARIPDLREIDLRAFCTECRKTHELTYNTRKWQDMQDTSPEYWYPENVSLPEGIRGSISYVHELYTNRNLKALTILRHFVDSVKNEVCRDLLKFCFSANLSKASSMNVPKVTGKGWTSANYSAYVIPDNFIEFNVWDGFSNKFSQCMEAKEQTNHLIGSRYTDTEIINSSSENLSPIPDNSIDYVLTDPPYADLVKYSERSFVRNAWLGFDVRDSSNEYSDMMQAVLIEIHRVLKTGRYLSFLLKGTSQEFRDELIAISENAGFAYRGADPEHLGYGDQKGENDDHVLNFVNYL